MESLLNGEDFSESLTRAKFEELNADLFKKTLKPLVVHDSLCVCYVCYVCVLVAVILLLDTLIS